MDKLWLKAKSELASHGYYMAAGYAAVICSILLFCYTIYLNF